MKRKLFVYGCSFSSPHLDVGKEDVYGHHLSKELDLDYVNFSAAGGANDMSLLYLSETLSELKENDILIFQFTSYDRRSYLRDEKNEFNFHTNAGLVEDNKQEKLDQFNQDSEIFDLNMIDILLKYHVLWNRRTVKILDKTINKILTYINDVKGVKVLSLYMSDDDFDIIQPNQYSITLPTKEKPNNHSMIVYNEFHGHTVSEIDPHPNKDAHISYKELIKQYI